MKKIPYLTLPVFILVFMSAGLSAQMDLLPFIFRDIPPEIEQGLPEDMTFEEFSQLNRNIDFFTVGMSMIVPGYGYFAVERPGAGYSILAGRLAGYGLMATALVRQWDDFRDIWDSAEISSEDWQRLKVNGFLFGSGAMVNFLLWGLDVLGAYHVSVQERNWVIYHHGISVQMRNTGEGDSDVIRFYREQDDPMSRLWLRSRLWQLIGGYYGENPPLLDPHEAYGYLAEIELGEGQPARAMALVLQGLSIPQGTRPETLLGLGIEILSHPSQMPWESDRGELWSTMNALAAGETDFPAVIEMAVRLTDRSLRRELVAAANRYLKAPNLPVSGDRVLMALEALWRQDGEIRLAAMAAAKLIAFYPDSPLLSRAILQAEKNFGELEDEIALEQLRQYY